MSALNWWRKALCHFYELCKKVVVSSLQIFHRVWTLTSTMWYCEHPWFFRWQEEHVVDRMNTFLHHRHCLLLCKSWWLSRTRSCDSWLSVSRHLSIMVVVIISVTQQQPLIRSSSARNRLCSLRQMIHLMRMYGLGLWNPNSHYSTEFVQMWLRSG